MRKLPDEERKSRIVGIRLTVEEYEKYHCMAEEEGISFSRFVVDALRKKKPKHTVFPVSETRDFLMQIGRIGGNVNQIARVLNSTGQDLTVADELKKIRADLDFLRDTITEGVKENGDFVNSRDKKFKGSSQLRPVPEGQEGQVHTGQTGTENPSGGNDSVGNSDVPRISDIRLSSYRRCVE